MSFILKFTLISVLSLLIVLLVINWWEPGLRQSGLFGASVGFFVSSVVQAWDRWRHG